MKSHVILALSLIGALSLHAQNIAIGRVDTAFAGSGAFSATNVEGQNVVRTVPGCKVLVAGSTVHQLLPNGTVDPAFTPPDTGGATIFAMTRLALGANAGKILIGGSFTAIANGGLGGASYVRRGLACLNEDGTINASFSADNAVFDVGLSTGVVQSFLELPDGKILVGGGFTNVNNSLHSGLVRLMPDGIVDSSFVSPELLTGFSPATRGSVRAMARQTVAGTEYLLIVGDFTSLDGTARPAGLARLQLNGPTPGALDLSFTPTAPAPYTIAGGEAPRAVVVQPDGKILVAGALAVTAPPLNLRTNIYRFSASGVIETAATFLAPAIGDSIDDLALQPDGKIIVVGEFTAIGATPRNRVARLLANGSLDTTFDAGTAANFSVRRAVIQPDQKILVAGMFTSFNSVANTRRVARLFGNALDSLPCTPSYAVSVFISGSSGSGTVTVTPPAPAPSVTCPGSCSPVGTYLHGTSLRFQGTPAPPDWRFAGWNVNGAPTTVNPVDVEITAATTVSANFERQHRMTVVPNDPAMSGGYVTSQVPPVDPPIHCPGSACSALFDQSVPASGPPFNFPRSRPIVLTAHPTAGTTVNWASDVAARLEVDSLDPNVARVFLFENQTITATFVPVSYSLTISPAPDGGTVSSTESPTPLIGCPGDCAESYLGGTTVQLIATPAAGYRFAGWTGGVNTDALGVHTVNMSGPRTITASFVEQQRIIVTVEPGGSGGRVLSQDAPSGSPVPRLDCPTVVCEAWFDRGSAFNPNYVRLTATPPSGWSVNWSGGLGNDDPNLRFVPVTFGDVDITATFVPPPFNFSTPLPAQKLVFCGVNQTLSVVVAGGTPPLTYVWRSNDVVIAAANSDSLTFAPAALDDGAVFQVTVRDGAANTISSSVTLRLQRDFGDAPGTDSPHYPTLLVDNGARHIIKTGFFLGAGVDAEDDARVGGTFPNDATGDDIDPAESVSDEDGIVGLDSLVIGQVATITVTASAAGKLDAWIDFNNDGDWNDSGERIADHLDLLAGENTVHFAVPADATINVLLFSRFRFSSVGVTSFIGDAPDGEVEDYTLTVHPIADLAVGIEFAPNAGAGPEYFDLTLSITNKGPGVMGGVANPISLYGTLPGAVSVIYEGAPGGFGPLFFNAESESYFVTVADELTPDAWRQRRYLVRVPIPGDFTWTVASFAAPAVDPDSANDFAQVELRNTPIIDTAPVTSAYCAGESGVLLSVRAHPVFGESTLTYQWRRNGINIDVDGVSQDYQAATPGSYDVIVAVVGGTSLTTPLTAVVVTENQPPVATDDTILASPATVVVIPPAALTANDTDPESQPLTVAAVDLTSASGGSITRAPDGAIVYTPPASGSTDSFRYRVTDGVCIRDATINVRFVASPIPAVNELVLVPAPAGGGGFLLPFNAPFAGTFALDRALVETTPFAWLEVARVTVVAAGTISFSDPTPSSIGAIYRIRHVTP